MAAEHRKPAWALDTVGGHYGKVNGRTILGRLQAHDKWEMSVCTWEMSAENLFASRSV